MPNYYYKCDRCETIYEINLPISHDPTLLYECSGDICTGTCNRIMRAAQIPKEVGKVFAGDWFKKTYGFELGGEAMKKEDYQKDVKKAEELAKRDGINFSPKAKLQYPKKDK